MAEPVAPARPVLDAWVRAQNAGDFAAYSALYADGFKGVRTPGSTAELDKAAWLKEAQPAFAKSAPVRLYFVEVYAEAGSFVQVSGSTREATAREITVARTGDRHQIVSERVLASRPLSPSRSTRWFRLDEHGDVILWQGNLAPPGLPAKLNVHRPEKDETELVVEARMSWGALPDAQRLAPLPVHFQLASAKKATSCQADEPRIAKRLPAGATEGTVEEIVRFAREDQLEPWTITAALPSCGAFDEPPAFARVDDRVTPKTVKPRSASRGLAAKAFAAFKRLPAWKSVGPKGKARTVELQLTTATGRSRYVALSYDSGNAGCAAWALWKVPDDGGATWELVHDPSDFTALYPQLAADFEGDGSPTIFGSDSADPWPFQQFALGWSASGLGAADGQGWIPLSHAQCGE